MNALSLSLAFSLSFSPLEGSPLVHPLAWRVSFFVLAHQLHLPGPPPPPAMATVSRGVPRFRSLPIVP
uniref:Putative secreted protein n=1 Tax=Anopheles triannulatus TaxID=58253 RepID=A0A2M4B7F5_9DIPT